MTQPIWPLGPFPVSVTGTIAARLTSVLVERAFLARPAFPAGLAGALTAGFLAALVGPFAAADPSADLAARFAPLFAASFPAPFSTRRARDGGFVCFSTRSLRALSLLRVTTTDKY